MQELLTLALVGAGLYAISRNSGLAAQSNELAPAQTPSGPRNPDLQSSVRASTGLPASIDNVTPGVLDTGEIRALPPATPVEVTTLTNNPALQPQVIDGQWRNATPGTSETIQNRVQQARGQVHWKPEILPPPTLEMQRAASEGNNLFADILPAAASEKFERGGFTAFTGYRLPVGVWNHYRLQYDGGQDITGSRLDDMVTAEEYWGIVRAAPSKAWALNGLVHGLGAANANQLGVVSRTRRANQWAT